MLELDGVNVYNLYQTSESEQITHMVKAVYYHIIEGREWPHLKRNVPLIPTEISTPTIFTLPENVDKIEWIKYNKQRELGGRDFFVDIKYLPMKKFTDLVNRRNTLASNIVSMSYEGIIYPVFNDRQPMYYSEGERWLVFDAWDNSIDIDGLDEDKFDCFAKINPVVEMEEDFVFDLPTEAFSYLLNECRSFIFFTYKGVVHEKAEQMARTQRRRMSWENSVIPGKITYPDYGRKGK